MKASASKKVPAAVDEYLPTSGNPGYQVSRYELDLQYRASTNRLAGSATITAVTLTELEQLTLDLSGALTVSKVSVNGKPAAHFSGRGGKLRIRPAGRLATGAALSIVVRYRGSPKPTRSLWGNVGFEELADGVLVAAQPNGAPSWFPCNDHPGAKAAFRIQVSTESRYRVIANGKLVSRRTKASQTVWTYEQPEPTPPYLITLQIGDYEIIRQATAPVVIQAALPGRLRRDFERGFARQPQMMQLFIGWFGPYPLAAGYTVVVTADALEIPVEAQGMSIFGANHCDGGRASEPLIAHELAHQWFGNSVTARRWRDIWLHEGFACYAEWLWSEHGGGPPADDLARRHHQQLRSRPQDLLLTDPGPRAMFDDRVYTRGALTLHALRGRLGDEKFFALLKDWATRYRHGTVITDDFTGLAANYSGESLRALWEQWLYATGVP